MQLALHRDSAITTMNDITNLNKHIVQVVEEAFQMVPKFAIPEGESVEVRVLKLATGVRDFHTELAKV